MYQIYIHINKRRQCHELEIGVTSEEVKGGVWGGDDVNIALMYNILKKLFKRLSIFIGMKKKVTIKHKTHVYMFVCV